LAIRLGIGEGRQSTDCVEKVSKAKNSERFIRADSSNEINNRLADLFDSKYCRRQLTDRVFQHNPPVADVGWAHVLLEAELEITEYGTPIGE
jgi:hypothetical protein